MRSWVVFKAPIKHALHELKYKNRRWLGEALAIHLAPQIEKTGWEFDVLIPIPLSQQRRAERGYNQVEQLAQPLSWIGGWNYRPEALSRVKHTQSQVSLSAVERKSNVKGAFSADAKLVSGKTVLLMDDVITTGATVSEAASALKSSGAQKVYAFSLARALKQSDLQEI
jgi:ComF family protein